jgi:hypothetical protein
MENQSGGFAPRKVLVLIFLKTLAYSFGHRIALNGFFLEKSLTNLHAFDDIVLYCFRSVSLWRYHDREWHMRSRILNRVAQDNDETAVRFGRERKFIVGQGLTMVLEFDHNQGIYPLLPCTSISVFFVNLFFPYFFRVQTTL